MRRWTAMTGRLVLVVVTLFAACSGPVWAATTEIEYGYPDQSVWTTRTVSTGEPDNPLLGFALALFKKADLPWRAHAYPSARLMDRLKSGETNFAMLVASPALSDCCLYGATPVAAVELRSYRHRTQQPIASADDLIDRRVILILGYAYGGLTQTLGNRSRPEFIQTAVSHASAFQMLGRGRGDYLVDYAGPSSDVLEATPNPTLTFDVISRLGVYLVLNKNYPDAATVLARLDQLSQELDRRRLLGPIAW